MPLPASNRKNVVMRGGKRKRLPDVPSLKIESELWDAGAQNIAGIDEVGRGSLAGPVTVGACVFPERRRIYKVRDSKLLDSRRREELALRIKEFCVGWGIGHASEREIDALGMGGALGLAASRALAAIRGVEVDVVILDGKWDYIGDERVRPVVHGDSVSVTIAAASILAKVERDKLMAGYSERFPGYGFEGHKGYSSESHIEALSVLGPSPIHRKTFAPVAAAMGKTPVEVKAEASGQLSLT